jgi:DNA-binding protein
MESKPRQQHQFPPNQVNVSSKRNSNFYVFLGKQILKEHSTIEFHALGNAVSTSVMAAENLVRNEYATFKQIRTETIDVDRDGQAKKAKLFITMERHPLFEENMKKFEEIKAENERLNPSTRETAKPTP